MVPTPRACARARSANAPAATRSASSPATRTPTGPFRPRLLGMRAVLERLNVYPDGSARALRRRLAEHLDVAEEHVVVGNGSNELLRLIAQAILAPGDECVFAWPSFVVYPMVCQLMGATEVRVPLAEGEVHDLDAMLAAVTDRTKLMFLCNPNNPTGTIYTRARVRGVPGQGSGPRAGRHRRGVLRVRDVSRVPRRPGLLRRRAAARRAAHVQQDLLAGRRSHRLRRAARSRSSRR